MSHPMAKSRSKGNTTPQWKIMKTMGDPQVLGMINRSGGGAHDDDDRRNNRAMRRAAKRDERNAKGKNWEEWDDD